MSAVRPRTAVRRPTTRMSTLGPSIGTRAPVSSTSTIGLAGYEPVTVRDTANRVLIGWSRAFAQLRLIDGQRIDSGDLSQVVSHRCPPIRSALVGVGVATVHKDLAGFVARDRPCDQVLGLPIVSCLLVVHGLDWQLPRLMLVTDHGVTQSERLANHLRENDVLDVVAGVRDGVAATPVLHRRHARRPRRPGSESPARATVRAVTSSVVGRSTRGGVH